MLEYIKKEIDRCEAEMHVYFEDIGSFWDDTFYTCLPYAVVGRWNMQQVLMYGRLIGRRTTLIEIQEKYERQESSIN